MNERQLLQMTRAEIQKTTGYNHAWLYLLTRERDSFELIEIDSEVRPLAEEHCLILPVAGDPMLEEIATGKEPVIVVDARTDPRTDQEIVAKMGCITIINVPVRLTEYPLGGLGTGTFTAEGARAPTPEEVVVLVDIADQVAIALARIRGEVFRQNARQEQEKLLNQLVRLKRKENLAALFGAAVGDLQRMLASASELASSPLMESSPQLLQLRGLLEQMDEVIQPLARLSPQAPPASLDVDLNRRIEGVLRAVSRCLPDDILVEAQLQDLSPVLGDGAQLDQLFVNLILAAKQAMPCGGSLSIRTAMQGETVQCEVSHRSRGLAVGSAFESELEMALCEHILRRHHGSMTSQRAPDGKTLTLELPGWRPERREPS